MHSAIKRVPDTVENGGYSMEFDIEAIDKKIRLLKKTALELSVIGEAIPAVSRNTSRILASLKMLELNITDVSID